MDCLQVIENQELCEHCSSVRVYMYTLQILSEEAEKYVTYPVLSVWPVSVGPVVLI